ncbi:MAG: eL32 family ribosomal protein [Candidatus Woesearchaeota archaeon]
MNLELRKQIKLKKPEFTRQDNHKKPKLGDKWRKPKGLQSKMRLHKRGYKRSPERGWGSPRDCKGLSPEGYNQVIISSLADVESLKEGDGAIISARVGTRKKIELVKKIQEKKFPILNLKDPKAFLDSVDKEMKKKQQEKKAKEQKRKAAEKEAEKKAEEEKQEQSEEKSEEKEDLADKLDEHKKKEKEEKDKVITKKE